MSLYNNAAKSAAGSGVIQKLTNGLASAAGGAVSGAIGGAFGSSAVGIGNAIGSKVTSLSQNALNYAVNKYIPITAQRIANTSLSALGSISNGNWSEAAETVWNSGLLEDAVDAVGSKIFKSSSFWHHGHPLYGGLKPSEFKEKYDEYRSVQYGKGNLFYLDVTSTASSYNITGRFNMFATEVSYSPFILTGDSFKVGGANVDSVLSCEPVELTITTYDDKEGNLKKWWAIHHACACAKDGTVAEPGTWAIRIRILHHVCDEEFNAYEDLGLFRPSNLQVHLNRRDDQLAELQMSFVQLDTFMSP